MGADAMKIWMLFAPDLFLFPPRTAQYKMWCLRFGAGTDSDEPTCDGSGKGQG
jgi:hypothetical protein